MEIKFTKVLTHNYVFDLTENELKFLKRIDSIYGRKIFSWQDDPDKVMMGLYKKGILEAHDNGSIRTYTLQVIGYDVIYHAKHYHQEIWDQLN